MSEQRKKEIETVRKWEQDLLLRILEADSIMDEQNTPEMNLKSQMMLRSVFHVIDTLLPVSYHDPSPTDTRYAAFHNAIRKNLYTNYVTALDADGDFFSARKVMIRAIRELQIEQEYDLLFLQRFRLGSIWDDSIFSVKENASDILFWPQDDPPPKEKGHDHE